MNVSDSGLIFQDDELNVPKLNKNWSREDVLAHEGMFFLKDIAQLLMIDAASIKLLADTCVDAGGDPWQQLGIKKVWNHWMIRMKVFAPTYRRELQPRYQAVPKHWDGNTLLRQEGVFLLTEVCRKIPFTAGQLRHQVRQNPNAELEYGIWKDAELGVFLVRMDRFAPWLQHLWAEGFGEDTRRGVASVSAGRKRTKSARSLPANQAKPAKRKPRTKRVEQKS